MPIAMMSCVPARLVISASETGIVPIHNRTSEMPPAQPGRESTLDLGRSGPMFIVELTYKATLAEIDANMAAHVIFLKKYYAAGNFLMSGRKIPRDGGIIVAVGKSRQQIETIVREDPFYARGLADFRVI